MQMHHINSRIRNNQYALAVNVYYWRKFCFCSHLIDIKSMVNSEIFILFVYLHGLLYGISSKLISKQLIVTFYHTLPFLLVSHYTFIHLDNSSILWDKPDLFTNWCDRRDNKSFNPLLQFMLYSFIFHSIKTTHLQIVFIFFILKSCYRDYRLLGFIKVRSQ